MGFLFHKAKNKPTAPSYVTYDQTPIPPRFIEYLKETAQYDPRLRNREDAIGYVLAGTDYRERALWYAYAVDCARHGRTMGNINKSRNKKKYEAFAEFASQSPEFMRSMDRMATSSYWDPSTSTNAYKLAAKWFP